MVKHKRFRQFLEKRKFDIVSAVLTLSDRSGITGITTKRIAKEVGFVEGAIYKHVKSKIEIFQMILEVSAKMLDEEFADIARRRLNPEQGLREWFGYAVNYLEDFPGLYRFLFSDELYNEDKKQLRRFLAILIKLRSHFKKMFSAGIKEGLFRPDIQPDACAILYLGVIQTSFTFWNVFDERRHAYHQVALPLFEQFMRTLDTGKSNREGV